MGQFIVDARTDAINRCKNIFSTINKHHGKVRQVFEIQI